MKQLHLSVEIWEQEPCYQGVIKQIERVGKLHTPSGKLSPEEYLSELIKQGSLSDLEHGTLYLRSYFNNGIVEKYQKNKDTKVNIPESKYDPFAYITTNYRVLVDNGWLEDLGYQLPEPELYHEKTVCVHFTGDPGHLTEYFKIQLNPGQSEFCHTATIGEWEDFFNHWTSDVVSDSDLGMYQISGELEKLFKERKLIK